MRKIALLIAKEFNGYFNSTIAYVFMVLFLAATSWLFFATFFLAGRADLQPLFAVLPWLFLFFIPAASMRLWAEERKSGTLELLLSYPVPAWQLAAGKFAASLLFLFLTLALTVPIVVTVAFLGNPDPGRVAAGYLGALLLGSACLAVGLFWSSVTVNQIVAFILTVVTIFILLVVDQFLFLFNLGPRAAALVGSVSFAARQEGFNRGVVDSRDLVFFATMTVLFLAFNVISLQFRKWK